MVSKTTDRECYDSFYFSNEYWRASTALAPARISPNDPLAVLLDDFSFLDTALEDWINMEQLTSRLNIEFNATNMRDGLPADPNSVPEQGRGYSFNANGYDPWLPLSMEVVSF